MASEEEVEARARSRVGSTLKDKWRLDELLGVGGMAAIYSATHRNLKRVAVKILHAEFSAHPEARRRFLREGYVANSIGHPGAVIIDDDDTTEDGSVFLVMELLEGETLHARWERKGRKLGLRQVLSYADALLDVLAAAQAKGVVHRDVKPENLFLTTSGTLKVLDFGIARVRELSRETNGTGTKLGAIMGTPAFMAPEQARGRWDHVDAQTDLWAVGATMFTLLSGRHVHEADTPNEQLALACTQPARSIATAVKNLPPRVVALIDRALSYDKAQRWPDATSMQTELRAAFAELKSTLAEARAASGPDSRPSGNVIDLGPEMSGAFPAIGEAQLEKVLVDFREPAVEELERISAPPLKSTEMPTVMRSADPTAAGVSSGDMPRSSTKPTVFLLIAAVAIAAVAVAFFAGGSAGTMGNEPVTGAALPSASSTAVTAPPVSNPPPAPSASVDVSNKRVGGRTGPSSTGSGKGADKRKAATDASSKAATSAAPPAVATPAPTPTDTAKPAPTKSQRDLSDLGF